MRRLLLLDDSIDFLMAVKLKLERAGFEVTSFSSCVSAMEFVAESSGEFDVILSDLKMPDASGLDFLSGLRETDGTTPFYIMTADETFEPKRTLDLGGQGTFFKPLNFPDMISTLKNSTENSSIQAKS